MDVKTISLDGKLKVTTFMSQPEGYIIGENKEKVYKVKKSFYQLKEFLSQLYLAFHKAMIKLEYVANQLNVVYMFKIVGATFAFYHYTLKIIFKLCNKIYKPQ